MSIKTELTCDKCGKKLELDGPYHVAKKNMGEWRNINAGTKDAPDWQIRCEECRGKK